MNTKHKRSVATNSDKSKTLTSKPPDYLTGHGADIWRETIADLEPEGRPINVLNRQALYGFCDSAAMVRECGEILARDGQIMDGGREGCKRNPAAALRISALSPLRAYAAELGLTPARAEKLPAIPKPKEHNPFDDL